MEESSRSEQSGRLLFWLAGWDAKRRIRKKRVEEEKYTEEKDTEEKGKGGKVSMIRIAVVEDDAGYRSQLRDYLDRYQKECGEELHVEEFSDGLDIAEGYRADYDMILMDIQMKHMNGMQAAQSIRQLDRNVVIIFITNLAQYAVQGYKVEALDYVLKPIQYFAFSQVLQNALKKVHERRTVFLHLMQKGRMVRLDIARIYYIESRGHNVTYHTEDEDYTERKSLKELEQKLPARYYAKCNSCYLVNLAQVERVIKDLVTVGGTDLQISRARRRGFLEALASYVGGE